MTGEDEDDNLAAEQGQGLDQGQLVLADATVVGAGRDILLPHILWQSSHSFNPSFYPLNSPPSTLLSTHCINPFSPSTPYYHIIVTSRWS